MTTRSSTALVEATGCDYDDWFARLDDWGEPEHTAAEARAWLRDQHGMSAWWAQKLVVEYEQARGIRVPGARPDGTITIGTSRTVGASPTAVFAAIVDPDRRSEWLPDVPLTERTTRPARSARFDGPDGTRITVAIEARGDAKAVVSIEQERLPADVDRDVVRTTWARRLESLRTMLAGDPG